MKKGYDWKTCPPEIKDYVFHVQKGVSEIINNDVLGFYLHGSLAMGGFNPNRSDIDILVIAKKSMRVKEKRKLAQFFLSYSTSLFPIEISFLNIEQLRNWQHPCPFEFHYSEFWRKRYENELLNNTYEFLNEDLQTDGDLAAHITMMNHRGVCVKGEPIDEVFPLVPQSDYLSSILGDYRECFHNVEVEPIYCSLNLIRVLWYLKEGVISSKQEAGNWSLNTFPQEFNKTLNKIIDCYANRQDTHKFEKDELILLRNYISENVQKLLNSSRYEG